MSAPQPRATGPWWRDAVVYQVYPRSFADASGDGIGDLAGITGRLDHLATLGVDAIWIGPVFASPQVDHGYDVADYRAIDPLFGSLADLDALVGAAHARGIRVVLDLVPNHTSDRHPWFRAAIEAGRDSPERRRYHFRDGRGAGGDQPPSNWRSAFGGPSWTRIREPDGTPGQWYYHLFAPGQPDLDWGNPEVLEEFLAIIRFWLDRGVDGFRIDVADGLAKDPDFGDTPDGLPLIHKDATSPVHDVYRAFRRVLDGYDGDRVAVLETGTEDATIAAFLRPDESQLAFNFRFLLAGFDAGRLRAAIEEPLAANGAVGAPTVWVVENHDVPRVVTRYGGNDRARAIALLLLALPGMACLYNGQELGLPNVDDLPDDVLQDPIWERSGRTERGRDGCRVPMPWSGDRPPFGFTAGSSRAWLPQPASWAALTVEREAADPGSMLTLYRTAMRLRRSSRALGRGDLAWAPSADGVLALDLTTPGETVRVMVNAGATPVPLPPGDLLLASGPLVAGRLPPDAAAWIRVGSR